MSSFIILAVCECECSLGFSIYRIMLSANKDSFAFLFSNLEAFCSFFLLDCTGQNLQ